jgi:hypothetical protein
MQQIIFSSVKTHEPVVSGGLWPATIKLSRGQRDQRQLKQKKPGLCGDLRSAPIKYSGAGGAKDKISVYI